MRGPEHRSLDETHGLPAVYEREKRWKERERERKREGETEREKNREREREMERTTLLPLKLYFKS